MPQKTKSTPAKTWDNMLFVNCELDAEQMAQCKAVSNDFNTLTNALEDFLRDGHKISLSYDQRNEVFGAYAMAKELGHRHWQLMLVGRGSSPLKALKQLMFKHFQVLDGHWPRPKAAPKQQVPDD